MPPFILVSGVCDRPIPKEHVKELAASLERPIGFGEIGDV
jgi:hypothetical protein